MHDPVKCIITDIAVADIGMAVFSGTTGILAVIDMKDGNLILANQMIKAVHDTIKIMNDLLAGIMDMTGIKADTESVTGIHAVIDPGEIFKVCSDLGAFSCHGF